MIFLPAFVHPALLCQPDWGLHHVPGEEDEEDAGNDNDPGDEVDGQEDADHEAVEVTRVRGHRDQASHQPSQPNMKNVYMI